MARYTIELRTIVESGYNIFNFPYEFFDVKKKKDFEQKFIDHFYFREIGSETVGRFCHYLKDTFQTKLPYYNELFSMSLLEYDKVKNYDLSETFTKTANSNNSLTGSGSVNGSTNEISNNSNTVNREAGIVATGESTNSLDSTTDHTEDQTFNKNEKTTESRDTEKETTRDIDNKHVESETPSGLLSMSDISKNVYASKAVIDDNTDKLTDKDKVSGEKNGESKEETDRTSKDTVQAVSKDTSTNTNDETVKETSSGGGKSDTTFNNFSSNSQTANGTQFENYTRNASGNIGVQTSADILEREIILRQKLARIELQFFSECEDLFMQIYSF